MAMKVIKYKFQLILLDMELWSSKNNKQFTKAKGNRWLIQTVVFSQKNLPCNLIRCDLTLNTINQISNDSQKIRSSYFLPITLITFMEFNFH